MWSGVDPYGHDKVPVPIDGNSVKATLLRRFNEYRTGWLRAMADEDVQSSSAYGNRMNTVRELWADLFPHEDMP